MIHKNNQMATTTSTPTQFVVEAPSKPRVKKAPATKKSPVEKSTTETTDAPASLEITSATVTTPPADDMPLGDRITERMNSLVEKMTSIESTVSVVLKEMKIELKTLQKDLVKFQKISATNAGKRKRAKVLNADGTEAPRRTSGFEKPTGISDQLADFLSIPRGAQLPRMEVTKRINEYIREHDLQNPKDRRQLIPNKELHAVLGTTAETVVSYFNYQGFLKGHFIAIVPKV